MPANLGLAQLSNAFLIATLLCYSLAVLAFAGDLAFGRRRGTAAQQQARARVPELVGAGAADAAVAGDAAAGGLRAPGSVPGAGPAGARSGEGSAVAGPRREGRAGPWVRAALAVTMAGLAAHLLGVVTRGLAVHRIPWGNMYEFVTALTCVAVIFFLGLMIRYQVYRLGLFVMGAVVLALGLAQTVIYTQAGPLVPALQSYWLSIHVTAMTLATGTYFVAAVLGVVYLFAERNASRVAKRERQAAGRPARADGIMRRLPGPEALDRLAYRTVMFAFPIWTFGIIAGAIWADQAWGRYWGWDPTETWAFITWVVYACFLHARATAGWRGKKAAVVQLVGFCCLVFNLIGVSLFITGLHSYAGLN
jgi:cytochrome c-type biogenesis protein CcsB